MSQISFIDIELCLIISTKFSPPLTNLVVTINLYYI